MITRKISDNNNEKSLFSDNINSLIQSAGNQILLNNSNKVGTSETTRVTSNDDINFYNWLAGLIDGDGCFQISKKGYLSLEITTEFRDLPLLMFIKNKLGGSVKLRSGAKAYRYRLHHNKSIIPLIYSLNGLIRHSSRLKQFHKICIKLNIELKDPEPLTLSSYWFSGFFDADGTIVLNKTNNRLSVRVTNKLQQDVAIFKETFGGSIYFDTSQNGYYCWSIQSRPDILNFLTYFEKVIFRSFKSKRFYLIKTYLELKDLKAYKLDSVYYKNWLILLQKWNYSLDEDRVQS